MSRSSALVVSHASAMGGAELCLLDFASAFEVGSEAFLFVDGPLRPALEACGLPVTLSRQAGNFASVKKDRSLLRAAPHMVGLMRVVQEVSRRARTHRYLYANSQKAFVVAALASALAHRPLVWHLHDILTPGHFGLAQRRLVVTLANRFTRRVIVPSQAAAQAFIEAGGRQSLIRIVANGIDLPVTSEPVSRKVLGLPQGTPVFGIFSRISPWKGQHVGIKALAHLPAAVHCVVVGSSLFGEEEYARSLSETAARLGVTDRVVFLGQRDNIIGIMRCVDAMVHPSIEPEPFGRTFIEAMLARVPIIAGDFGAAPEILDHGKCGILIPPNDPAALARSLQAILVDGLDTRDLVAAAYQRANDQYSVAKMTAATRAAVQSALV